MGKLIVPLVIALVLFTLSAAGSWYLQSQLATKESASGDDHEKDNKKASGKSAKPDSAQAESNASFRPGYSPEADQTSGLSVNLKQREDAIKQREEVIASRVKTFDLITQDWRLEKSVTEELQKKLDADLRTLGDGLAAMEKAKSELRKERKETEDSRSELAKKTIEVAVVEASRLPQMAAMYDGLDPEKAANNLTVMVEKGKLDLAVKILSAMKQRSASNVLSQMTPPLTSQLMERLKELQPTKKE